MAVCAMWIPVAAELNLTVPYGSGVDLQMAAIASRQVVRTDAALLSSVDRGMDPGPDRGYAFSDPALDGFIIATVDGMARHGGPTTEVVPAPFDASVPAIPCGLAYTGADV